MPKEAVRSDATDRDTLREMCRMRDITFHHAQKVLAADFQPERPGNEVYTVESFRRHAYLLTCDGEAIWEYDNFTRARAGYECEDPRFGPAIGRLTTAGDLIV